MGPANDLPYGESFTDSEQYVASLLDFAQASALFKTLCGGVHILDFFTNTPDLYAQLLPEDWRGFIVDHSIMDFLDVLMREPVQALQTANKTGSWRDGMPPPDSLVAYISEVRKHLLLRVPAAGQCARNRAVKPTQKMARRVAVGMNIKKVHEVGLFASYVDQLTRDISTASDRQITHLVDFGSGQNYLGRALASLPYSKNIVAIETKGHNQDRAKELDRMARLSDRECFRYDKSTKTRLTLQAASPDAAVSSPEYVDRELVKVQPADEGIGSVQYVEHHIDDGSLRHVIEQISTSNPAPPKGDLVSSFKLGQTESPQDKQLLVMSLHSCGNLVHHGLRSLVLNEEVKAVAMVGCCYNLITERLSPATYKLPELRPSAHPRLEAAAMACDPHGFPMSDRLCNIANEGLHLNITARMMAVQAPSNWGEKDSDGFFTRHFYRALLQRLFLDKGVVGPPNQDNVGGSPLGHTSGTPIIIGSLRKSCYDNFTSYVRGALTKLMQDPERGAIFNQKLGDLKDSEFEEYEQAYRHRKKELSAVWALMAFSAGVVEALIVVDRYLWLKEQKEVARAWVEPVFDYALSPRNLVVVGIKK